MERVAVLAVVTLVVSVVGLGWVRPLSASGTAPTGSVEVGTSRESIPSAVILHGPLLVVGEEEGFTARRIEGGAVAWRAKPCPGAMPAGPVSAVDRGRLAFRCGETLGAIDLTTGQVLWKVGLGGEPTTLRTGAGVIAVSLGDRVEVYDGRTGAVRFEHRGAVGNIEDLMVAIGVDRVYVGEDRGLHAYDLEGRALWTASGVIPSTVVEVGWLVLVRYENDITALDKSDGRQRGATWVDTADASYSAAVTVGDGVGVLVGGSGGPFGIDADHLRLAWEHEEPARFIAAADGVILVTTGSEVVALGAADGDPIGRCPKHTWLATVDRTRIACGRADDEVFTFEVRALD